MVPRRVQTLSINYEVHHYLTWDQSRVKKMELHCEGDFHTFNEKFFKTPK